MSQRLDLPAARDLWHRVCSDSRVSSVYVYDDCVVIDLAEGFEFGGGSMIRACIGPDTVDDLAADLSTVTRYNTLSLAN